MLISGPGGPASLGPEQHHSSVCLHLHVAIVLSVCRSPNSPVCARTSVSLDPGPGDSRGSHSHQLTQQRLLLPVKSPSLRVRLGAELSEGHHSPMTLGLQSTLNVRVKSPSGHVCPGMSSHRCDIAAQVCVHTSRLRAEWARALGSMSESWVSIKRGVFCLQ